VRHRQPNDSLLPALAQDQLLAELRRTRDAVNAAQRQLRRQAPLTRALDSLFLDIDDIAFLLTGNRDHFTRPLPPSTKRPDPDYRKTRHELTNLEGYAGLDKQLGTAPERDEE
jgi:hypothetical protein